MRPASPEPAWKSPRTVLITGATGGIGTDQCPDLVIANAGITRMIGRDEDSEPLDAALDVLAVNLEGALATFARGPRATDDACQRTSIPEIWQRKTRSGGGWA